MRREINWGDTDEERAYVDMLTREDRREENQRLPGYRLLTFTTRTYVGIVIQEAENGKTVKIKVRRVRRTPQEKRLVRIPDGRAFVPYESGKNGTDERASEALEGRVSNGEDVSARNFINILREQERQRVLEKVLDKSLIGESGGEDEGDEVTKEQEWRF